MSLGKIVASDIKIERISERHDVSQFKSYENELVQFLQEDALDNQRKRISVTYLWFLRTGELMGYVTLLNDRINLEGDLKINFKQKNIRYHSLPALKIGRLCVDNKFLRMGVGTLMIAFAAKIAHHIYHNYSGCRFIVLDSLRNKENDVIHFYKRIGFDILKERQKGTTPMYLDLVNNVELSL